MYTLALEPRARAGLQRLSAQIRKQVLQKLEDLCRECDERRHQALKGKHRGKFRLRVAHHYRVLYAFDRRTRKLTVYQIGHRSSIY